MNLIIQFNRQTSLMVSLLYWSKVDSGENCYILFADPELFENLVLGDSARSHCFNIVDFDFSLLREFDDLEIITQTDEWNLEFTKKVIELISHDDPSRICSLSYYSDGVLNAFFHLDIITGNAAGLYSDFCKIKCFYFFGETHEFYLELSSFNKKNISYQAVNRASLDCISYLEIDDSKCTDIIVVSLRLWGDHRFHNGNYHFKRGYKDSAFILSELINDYYKILNKKIPILVRVDFRDLEFSQRVIDELSSSYKFELIEDFFPKTLLLEQILIYFTKSSYKVSLINFDSSAVVYACAGNLADSILVGCDLLLLKDVVVNDNVHSYIHNNIDIYTKLIPDLFDLYDLRRIKDGLYIFYRKNENWQYN